MRVGCHCVILFEIMGSLLSSLFLLCVNYKHIIDTSLDDRLYTAVVTLFIMDDECKYDFPIVRPNKGIFKEGLIP